MTITKLIDGLPNQSMSQADFDAAAANYMAELPEWAVEVNATKDDMNALAAEAAGSASTATTKAGEASTSAGTASTQAGIASTQAGIATTKAGEAAASAAAAAASSTSLKATSTTDITIATGTLTFVTQPGKAFAFGDNIKAVDQTNAGNAVYGTVAAYSGTSLQIAVASYDGGGLVSDWNISLTGQRGATGPAGGVNGGNLTGALNENKGADLASAATPDIWSGAGNFMVMTGTAGITGFSAAPQPGARRSILAGAAFTLTAGANMLIKGVQSGQSFTVAPGDEISVRAETTTKFRVTITKGDGTAMAGLYGSFQTTLRLVGTGTFVARRTGWHRVTLAGGCGRGGFAMSSQTKRATGASGAGFCVGMVFLVAGQSYNYTQGQGASAASLSAAGAVQGANGGASIFFGSGIRTLTANGGNAGSASVSSNTTLVGPVGGTATGGDINVQGGKAGDVSGNATNGAGASGGGAVGIQGVGYASGDVDISVAVGATAASGGAGVGGGSGAANATTGTLTLTGAGGYGGASPAATNAVGAGSPNYAGNIGDRTMADLSDYYPTLLNTTAGGPGGAQNNQSSTAGAGSAGFSSAPGTGPGAFSGAGGLVSTGDLGSSAIGVPGGIFGGGGGGIAIAVMAGTTTVPAGQAGFVQIEY